MLEEFEIPGPSDATDIKYSWILSHVNRNGHTKASFTSILITWYNMYGFKKKLQEMQKWEKKHSLKKQSNHQNQTKYRKDTGIIRQGIQLNYD